MNTIDDKVRDFAGESLFKRFYDSEARAYIEQSRKIEEDYSDEYVPGDSDSFMHAQDYSDMFWSRAEEEAQSPDDLVDYLGAVPVEQSYDSLPDGSYTEATLNAFHKDYVVFRKDYAAPLEDYLESIGRDHYEFTGVTEADLGPGALAGMAIDVKSGRSALVGSTDYEKIRNGIARHYNVSPDVAAEYGMSHELIHQYQKGMDLSTMSSEADVERTLMDYFSERAKADPENAVRYKALAAIAEDRLYNIHNNYKGSKSPRSGNSLDDYIGSTASKIPSAGLDNSFYDSKNSLSSYLGGLADSPKSAYGLNTVRSSSNACYGLGSGGKSASYSLSAPASPSVSMMRPAFG